MIICGRLWPTHVTAISARDSGFVGFWNRLLFPHRIHEPISQPPLLEYKWMQIVLGHHFCHAMPCYSTQAVHGSPCQPMAAHCSHSSSLFFFFSLLPPALLFVFFPSWVHEVRQWDALESSAGSRRQCREALQFSSAAIPFHAISCHVIISCQRPLQSKNVFPTCYVQSDYIWIYVEYMWICANLMWISSNISHSALHLIHSDSSLGCTDSSVLPSRRCGAWPHEWSHGGWQDNNRASWVMLGHFKRTRRIIYEHFWTTWWIWYDINDKSW